MFTQARTHVHTLTHTCRHRNAHSLLLWALGDSYELTRSGAVKIWTRVKNVLWFNSTHPARFPSLPTDLCLELHAIATRVCRCVANAPVWWMTVEQTELGSTAIWTITYKASDHPKLFISQQHIVVVFSGTLVQWSKAAYHMCLPPDKYSQAWKGQSSTLWVVKIWSHL